MPSKKRSKAPSKMTHEEFVRYARREMKYVHTPQDILIQATHGRLWRLEKGRYHSLSPEEAMEWFSAKGRRARLLYVTRMEAERLKLKPFRSVYYREEVRKRYLRFHSVFAARKEAEIGWLRRHAVELKKQLPPTNFRSATGKEILKWNEKLGLYYATLSLLHKAQRKLLDSKRQFIQQDKIMPGLVKETLIKNIEAEEAKIALEWSRKYKTYVRVLTRMDILQEHPELPEEERKTIGWLKLDVQTAQMALKEAEQEFELERSVYRKTTPELKHKVLKSRLEYYKALNTLLTQYLKSMALLGVPLVKATKNQLRSAVNTASAHVRALERTLGIRKR